jgi:acylphosphatase
METTRLHVWITGLVQGVNFRFYTREQAQQFGLSGWVRNLRDGRVEAILEGEAGQVERMLAWCRRGPPAARVERIDEERGQATGEFSDFRIRW